MRLCGVCVCACSVSSVVSYTGLGRSTSSLGCVVYASCQLHRPWSVDFVTGVCVCVFVDQYAQCVYRIQMYIYNLVVQNLTGYGAQLNSSNYGPAR